MKTIHMQTHSKRTHAYRTEFVYFTEWLQQIHAYTWTSTQTIIRRIETTIDRYELDKKERMKNRNRCFWPGRTHKTAFRSLQHCCAQVVRTKKNLLLLHNLCAFIV